MGVMINRKAELQRWARFSSVALVALVVSVGARSFIPDTLFVLLLAASLMANVVGVIWAFFLFPFVCSASTEALREMNYHPDALVRAIQKEEITIEDYVHRRSDSQSVGPDDTRG